MYKWIFLLILLSTAFLTGCNDNKVDSTNIPTSTIYAEFHVVQYEAGEVIAQARLRKDSANSTTYVELKNGDQLVASVGASLYDVSLSNDLFTSLNSAGDSYRRLHGGPATDYSGLFDIFVPPSGDYSQWYSTRLPFMDDTQAVFIGLYRRSLHNALNTRAILPAPFQILEPVDGSTQAGGSDLQVSWDNFNDSYTLSIVVESVCQGISAKKEYNFTAGNDIGYAVIAASDLHRTGVSGDCFVTISLDRKQPGILDSEYLGGSIYSHQIRSVTFSVP